MTKRSIKSIIAVMMILTIALYFISGTYARYASEFTGTASIDIASWKVKLAGDEEGTQTKIENLKFTVVDNENVVEGKIAPEVEAKAKVEVDISGTEVAVEVIAEATEENLQSALGELGIETDDIEFSVAASSDNTLGGTGNGTSDSPYVIALNDKSKGFAEGSKVGFDITLKWTNNEHNAQDTGAGKKGGKLEIPVTLKVQQHIDAKS